MIGGLALNVIGRVTVMGLPKVSTSVSLKDSEYQIPGAKRSAAMKRASPRSLSTTTSVGPARKSMPQC